MKINLRGGLAAAAGSISNIAGQMIAADAQKMRDERMNQYAQQQQQSGFAQQSAIQSAGFDQQTATQEMGFENQQLQQQRGFAQQDKVVGQQLAGASNAAMIKAQADIASDARDLENKKSLETHKGEVNPDSSKNLSEFDKKLDGKGAEIYSQLQTASIAAAEMEDALTTLEEIAEGFQTGFTQELVAKVGLPFGTDNAAALQAYKATSIPLILERSKLLSGAISEKEIEMIASSVANFGLDERANSIIIGGLRKAMGRAKANFEEAESFRVEHKNLRGFTPSSVANINSTSLGQDSIGASSDPLDVLSGFNQWKSAN